MTPTVEASVVIPTCNRRDFLRTNALATALAQEDVELEVIVVDDGSTDGTAAMLEELADPRLRLLRHPAPRGVGAARNAGIGAALGGWVAFLDDDDLWSPQKLRAHIDACDGAEWGYAGAIVVDEGLRPLWRLPLPEPSRVRAALLTGNVVPGGPSNVVVKTSLLRRLGGFDETLRQHTEDWDLWIRLAASSTPAVCPDVLVATLQHGGRSALGRGWDVVREAERVLGKHGEVEREQLAGVAEWLAFAQHRGGHRLRAAWLFLRTAMTFRSPGNLPPAVGALFGRRGMRIAGALLETVGRGSHVEEETSGPGCPDPEWLARFRAAGVAG